MYAIVTWNNTTTLSLDAKTTTTLLIADRNLKTWFLSNMKVQLLSDIQRSPSVTSYIVYVNTRIVKEVNNGKIQYETARGGGVSEVVPASFLELLQR
jgi:hypothetical protein